MEVQKALTKRKVVFLPGSVHFHFGWWEGSPHNFAISSILTKNRRAKEPSRCHPDGFIESGSISFSLTGGLEPSGLQWGSFPFASGRRKSPHVALSHPSHPQPLGTTHIRLSHPMRFKSPHFLKKEHSGHRTGRAMLPTPRIHRTLRAHAQNSLVWVHVERFSRAKPYWAHCNQRVPILQT